MFTGWLQTDNDAIFTEYKSPSKSICISSQKHHMHSIVNKCLNESVFSRTIEWLTGRLKCIVSLSAQKKNS